MDVKNQIKQTNKSTHLSLHAMIHLKQNSQPRKNVYSELLCACIMPRLHLPSDEFTVPVQCPNHFFCVVLLVSYGFKGSVASTICLTPHYDKFLKNCKPIAPRHIARRSPYGHRTLIVRTMHNFR